MKNKKTESIADYLNRGGNITKVPYVSPEKSKTNVHIQTASTVTILSLDEADFWYGKPLKTKKKPAQKVNIDLLPAHLREKYLSRLKFQEEKVEENESEEDEA